MTRMTHVPSRRLQMVIRANDAGAVADLMAADGVIEWPFAVPTAPQRLEGRDEIREYVTRSPVASLMRFDDLRLAAIHETLDPEVIVVESTTCGTVVATGRRFELPAIAVLRIRGGEIVSYRDTSTPSPGRRRRADCRNCSRRSRASSPSKESNDDTVSSLGSIDFRFDDWRVDVALTGTQKGLMLPPGTAVLCVGERAQAAAKTCTTPRYFYDWRPVVDEMAGGYFPYTPATLLLFGTREALRMLLEEGLENVFARHARLAEATRRAVGAWDLALGCQEPERASNSLTA